MKQFIEQIRQNKWGAVALICRILFLILALFPGSMVFSYWGPDGFHYSLTNYFNSAIGPLPYLTWFCTLIAAGFGVPKRNDPRWISIAQAALALLAATALSLYILDFHFDGVPPFLYAAMPVLAALHLVLSVGAAIFQFCRYGRLKK